MTTAVNPTLTEIETIFYNLIWTPMIKAGEVWIAGEESAIPILDLGITQDLEDDIVQAITDAMYKQLVLWVDVTTITLLNAAHQAAYTTASEQLVIIAQEQGITSEAYLQAQATALADLSKFTQLN